MTGVLIVFALLLILLTIATCDAAAAYLQKTATKQDGWSLGFYACAWWNLIIGVVMKLL